MPYTKRVRTDDSDGICLFLPREKDTNRAVYTVKTANFARKEDVNSMEHAPPKVESIREHFSAVLEQINQLETESEKNEALAVVKSCLDSFQKSSTSALTLPNTTDNYERYKPRTDAIEHLQRVWGRYLTYFGAKEDVLYQQDLWRLDEGLMSAICSQIKYKNKTGKMEDKVADVIKPMKEKVKKQVIGLSEEEIKKSGRIYKAAYKYSPVYHS